MKIKYKKNKNKYLYLCIFLHILSYVPGNYLTMSRNKLNVYLGPQLKFFLHSPHASSISAMV